MKVMNWIKENITLSFMVGLNNLKIKTLILPFYILLQVSVYFYFRNSLYQNGFWIIMTPMLATLILALIVLIPKRNNPNFQIYYLFHLSAFSKIIILIAAILLFMLYIFTLYRGY